MLVSTLPHRLPWASAGGGNGHLPPLEIGTKNQKFLKKLKLAAKFRLNWFNCCNHSLCGVVTRAVESEVPSSDSWQIRLSNSDFQLY